jgi:hypothetical protein
MRFRPANISVINRRACSETAIGPAVQNLLKAHQREPVPATPPVDNLLSARTVLAVKGSLRRARKRRALDYCAPFRPDSIATGGSGGNITRAAAKPENQTPVFKKGSQVAPYQFCGGKRSPDNSRAIGPDN